MDALARSSNRTAPTPDTSDVGVCVCGLLPIDTHGCLIPVRQMVSGGLVVRYSWRRDKTFAKTLARLFLRLSVAFTEHGKSFEQWLAIPMQARTARRHPLELSVL